MMGKLSIVNERAEAELSLSADVVAARAEHVQAVKGRVRLWMQYAARLGSRRLCLDDCPGMDKADHGWVLEWLGEEGFEVTPARWYRPAWIVLP